MLVYVRPSNEHLPIFYTSLEERPRLPFTARIFSPARPGCAKTHPGPMATTVSSWGLCGQEGHLAAPPFLYFIRNGLEFSPEAVVTVRRTRPFFPPLGTVVVMLSLVC